MSKTLFLFLWLFVLSKNYAAACELHEGQEILLADAFIENPLDCNNYHSFIEENSLALQLINAPSIHNFCFKKFKCTDNNCDTTFTSQFLLDAHIKSVHNKSNTSTPNTAYMPFCSRCPHCSQKYSIYPSLLLHIRRNHAPKNFICTLQKDDQTCTAKYALETDLKYHQFRAHKIPYAKTRKYNGRQKKGDSQK